MIIIFFSLQKMGFKIFQHMPAMLICHQAAVNGAIPHAAPITPDKPLGVQSRMVSRAHDFGENEQTRKENSGDRDTSRRKASCRTDQTCSGAIGIVSEAQPADLSI